MFTTTTTRNHRSGLATRLAALILAFGTVVLAPQAMAGHGWAQTASDGTVDEASKDIYKTTGVVMSILNTAPAKSTVKVRYNVPNIDSLNAGAGGNHTWQVRFRDNGTQSRIILKLKSYNWGTGETTTLMTFDSDDYPASNNFQLQYIDDVTGDWQFNRSSFAYYVEASIKRKTSDGNAALAGFYMWNN